MSEFRIFEQEYHISRYPSPKKDRFTTIQDKKNQIRLDTQTKCLSVLMGKKSIHSTLILMISWWFSELLSGNGREMTILDAIAAFVALLLWLNFCIIQFNSQAKAGSPLLLRRFF